METILAIYVGGGVLLALLSIPLILKWIPPNVLYGVRVRQTLADPDLWYPVNAYAGRRLLLAGLVAALGPLALYFLFDLSLDNFAWASLAIFGLAFAAALWQTFRYLNHLQRRKP